MVRITSIALAGLAAVGAVALPRSSKRDLGLCMTDDQAAFVASNYGLLISNYSNALADNVLATNFTDYAESVNTLINSCPQGAAAITLPLLAPTFSSRAQFEIGQGQQPAINFQQLNIWVSCNAVVIRWITTNTAPIPDAKPVVGLIAMEVVPNLNGTAALTYPWLIDTVYSEFDAGAWLQNLVEAGICPSTPCNATTSTTSSAVASATLSTSSTPTGSIVLSTTATLSASSSTYSSSSSTYSPSSSTYSPSSSTYSPSSSTAAASATSASSAAPVYTVTSTEYATSTSTTAVVVVVNPDGTVSEKPCDD